MPNEKLSAAGRLVFPMLFFYLVNTCQEVGR